MNRDGIYGECMRNHAPKLGIYVTDGCREFWPNNTAPDHCAACSCHRNFHRKITVTDEAAAARDGGVAAENGRNGAASSGNDSSTDEDSSRVAKHVHEHCKGKEQTRATIVIEDSDTEKQWVTPVQEQERTLTLKSEGLVMKKQRKTKFTREQTETMRAFAERLGWTLMNRERDHEVRSFCEEIGVSKSIFKTWLNNNKRHYGFGSSSGAKSPPPPPGTSNH